MNYVLKYARLPHCCRVVFRQEFFDLYSNIRALLPMSLVFDQMLAFCLRHTGQGLQIKDASLRSFLFFHSFKFELNSGIEKKQQPMPRTMIMVPKFF